MLWNEGYILRWVRHSETELSKAFLRRDARKVHSFTDRKFFLEDGLPGGRERGMVVWKLGLKFWYLPIALLSLFVYSEISIDKVFWRRLRHFVGEEFIERGAQFSYLRNKFDLRRKSKTPKFHGNVNSLCKRDWFSRFRWNFPVLHSTVWDRLQPCFLWWDVWTAIEKKKCRRPIAVELASVVGCSGPSINSCAWRVAFFFIYVRYSLLFLLSMSFSNGHND